MRSVARRQLPAPHIPRRCAVLSGMQREAALASRSGRAAASAGVSVGIGAMIVFAVGRASPGELFILWVLLTGWLAYWLFDRY